MDSPPSLGMFPDSPPSLGMFPDSPPSLGMFPEGNFGASSSEENVNQALGGNDAGPSNAGPSNAGLAQASGQPREGTSGGEERDGPPNTPGEISSKLADFLSAYGKRRAAQSFVERTATELGLEEAAPDKLLFIGGEILRLRREIDSTHPTSSGQNAAAALILAVEAWESRAPPTQGNQPPS